MKTDHQPEAESAARFQSLVEMNVVYNNLTLEYAKTLERDPSSKPPDSTAEVVTLDRQTRTTRTPESARTVDRNLPPELLKSADEFVTRGRETGKILDDPDERWEAQNMLNFWAKILYRHRHEPGDEPLTAALAPCEPAHPENEPIAFQAPPEPPDVYTGRQRFLSDLRQQLLTGRDLVLYGSPGTGKTLLAAKLSHDPELRKKYPDGVLWSRLGEQPDSSAILRRWTEALKISTNEEAWLDDEHAGNVIRQALRRRRMLLVIDDAWQAGEALALKLGGPNCAHIVTTYLMPVALGFDAQSVVTVPGLDRSDGLRLLAHHAPNAIGGQEVDAAELVESLDNSPLALSLLANYCRQHSSNGSRPNLKSLRRSVLKQKKAIEAERSSAPVNTCTEVQTQPSLLATISWCFEQLNPESQYVLHAVSALPPKPNTFSDDTARFITEGRADAIATLVNWGFLFRASDNRYSLHRAISDFVRGRPTAPIVDTAEQLIVEFFVHLVKTQTTNLHVLEQEEKNILAALEIAHKRNMWEPVVEGTNALFGYFDRQGFYLLAKKTLARAREAAEKSNDQHGLAAILLKLGDINERRSEYIEANKHLQASLEIAKRVEDEDVCARALQTLGVVAMAGAQYSDAERYLKEALELARRIKNTEIECAIETKWGWMERGVGRFKQSRTRTERALKLASRLNYIRQRIELKLSLGVLDFFEGNYEGAQKHNEEALDDAIKVGDKRLQCGLHQARGGVETELGNFAEAEAHLMKSLHLSTEIGHRWYNGVVWKELGELRLKQQLPNVAASAFKKAVELAREVNSPELIGLALYGLARVAALQKNYAEARLQAQTSLNIFEQIGHHKKKEVTAWLSSIDGSTSE